jgi:hypothetical protein
MRLSRARCPFGPVPPWGGRPVRPQTPSTSRLRAGLSFVGRKLARRKEGWARSAVS